MSPWFGKIALAVGLVVMIALRVPHDSVSQKTKVVESRRGALEIALLALMAIGTMLLPAVFIATSLLSVADYEFTPWQLGAGCVVLVFSLWLFHRSHADLGRNWSKTLEIREDHAIVSHGVYSKIRHPMYTSIFLFALAQALLLPNWIAGPACFVAFTVMFALRIGAEERMMTERFGDAYAAYRARTKRLVPWLW